MRQIGMRVCGEGMGPVVAIGGGAGPSLVARALAPELDRVVAVVCTSDRGSSTGHCRRLFHMPAPGDVRAAVATFAALSGKESLASLLDRRLRCPVNADLDGMALGNLILAALFQEEGDLGLALARLKRTVDFHGEVLAVTTENCDLEAELEDGNIVMGELEVRRVGKAPIRRLGWAGKTPQAAPGVLEAIVAAELILLGPGCLYTSLLPCLLVKGVTEAIRRRRGPCIYICNTTTTPGQTEGYSVSRHVMEVLKVLGKGGLDGVILHRGELAKEVQNSYSVLGVAPLDVRPDDLDAIGAMGAKVWLFPLIEEPPAKPRSLHKVDTIRHDPAKLRKALQHIAREWGIRLLMDS